MKLGSFLDIFVYKKPLFSIKEQFNIDSFLDCEGHHWDILLLAHIMLAALALLSSFSQLRCILLAVIANPTQSTNPQLILNPTLQKLEVRQIKAQLRLIRGRQLI